ncbi:MAG: response regulator transcription factor [Bryobacteraceae bacterium]|nr:response regulator transcription factor [Bryobacteraceae bacterium]
MAQRRILVVEDEAMLAMLLSDRLTSEGFMVETAGDGNTGLSMAATGNWDLVILDVMLPGIDGFRVCESLRSRGVTTPVLMLTARGEVRDRVAGLKIGADDYLPKPFDVSELLARIEALMRRHAPVSHDTAAFGPVLVDRIQKTVMRAGTPVDLSFKEFQMLCYLLDRPETPVSREELLQRVWGYQHTPNTRTVDVHMAQLRSKLEDNPKEPRYLVTAHGFGYKFAQPKSSDA